MTLSLKVTYWLWLLKFRIKEICQGWWNLLTNKDNREAGRRIAICSSCKFKSKLNFCKDCGCFIPAKCFSVISNCSKGYWDEKQQ